MKTTDWMKLMQVVVLCMWLVACGPSSEVEVPSTLVAADIIKEREINEVAQVEPADEPTERPVSTITNTVVLTATVSVSEETTTVVTAAVNTVELTVVSTVESTDEDATPTAAQATATAVSFPTATSASSSAPSLVQPSATPLPSSSSSPSLSATEIPLPTGVWPTTTPLVPTATFAATATSVIPDIVPTATVAEADTLTGAWPTNTPRPTNTPWPTNTPRPVPPTSTPWPTSPSPAGGNASNGGNGGNSAPSGSGGGQGNSGNVWVNAVPGNPTPYLSNFQMITFYGSPYGRALGILGNQARTQTDIMLQQHADMFQSLDARHAIPTYHMVTTVANVTPPRYSHHAGMDIIEEWVAAAEANGYGVILDVQPGHVDSVEELNRVRHLLYKPHVHFAIDPEFIMGPGQVPGVFIGRVTAEEINRVQAQLHQIALEIGVKKVLMVHQFKDSMIVDKENIVNYSGVELLIDSDGAFNTSIKTKSYLQYASEPGFEFGGIKYFYEHDDYVPTASEIMSLNPRPAIIIYQ